MAENDERQKVEDSDIVSNPRSSPFFGSLDKADFKAVDFINHVFPNEASLVAVDPLIERLRNRIRKVDDEILISIRHQSVSGSKAKEDLSSAINAIKELSLKIHDIKSKAEESEMMVQDICRDIKKLDYAKKHITATITALNRLGMLVLAVDRLHVLASQRQYRDAAGQLEAVTQLCRHFEAYQEIPKISQLRSKFDNIKATLQSHIFADFSSLGSEGFKDNGQSMQQLADACLVVDALDPSVKQELLRTVCSKELATYQQIFEGTEVARLEKAERRYAWIKRQLKHNEEVWRIFPQSWQVPYLLCLQFCKTTRSQLLEILESGREKPDVATLIQALERTLEFEEDLTEKFCESGGQGGDTSGQQEADETVKKVMDFKGSISSCFEAHLGPYVDLEERQLMDAIDKLVLDETWEGDEGGQTNILASSTQMFLRIRKSFNRCTQLSKSQTLFSLCQVFQRVLRAYASKLTARLPKPGQGLVAAATGADWQVKTNEKEERVICFIANTAEYCHETVAQLAESIQMRIDQQYSQSIDMSEEQEEYSAVITKALSVLVLGLETKLDAELGSMARINWAAMESVGDQSDYVNQMSGCLSGSVPQISTLLSPVYFQFFVDKLAASFCPRFYANIFRCKRISGTGAQQLLLDTHALKTVLLEVPSLGGQSGQSSYTTYVTRELSKAESLLKVILSPVEAIADTYRALLPDGTIADFQRILDLKGIKKPEQQPLVDQLSRRVSPGGADAGSQQATSAAPAASISVAQSLAGTQLGAAANAASLLVGSTGREAMIARATALGRGAMAQSAAAAAAVSSTGALKRFFALGEIGAKDNNGSKKDITFRTLFNA